MPIYKACPRCKGIIPYGQTYCSTCAPIMQEEMARYKEERAEKWRKKYNRQYNKRRDPKYLAFYRSKAWKATSRSKLQSVAYKCEAKLDGCSGMAVEVHHVKPIQTPEGWEERLEWSNLEAVCTACHNGRHPEKLKRKQDDGVIDLQTIQR